MTDHYEPCHCGSGKKFKWCCEKIFPGIQQAIEQDEAGQHEAALQTIERVVQANQTNPEAWGQKARLLYINGKVDEGEEALEKAFALNPQYPYGLFLRANMRFQEGEVQGALLLARRAADAFDPAARNILAGLYSMIFDCEMRHNRPVAARAALEHVTVLAPEDDQSRQALQQVFGEPSRLPLAARRKYELMKPAADRRAAWNDELGSLPPRFSAIARAYEKLATAAPDDAPAWFNLGLSRAWMGDNKGAVAALESFIEKTADENAAVDAATLGEVLRCGQGMDEESDYVEHVITYQLRDPGPINNLLQEWVQARRLVPLPNEQEGLLTALILELTTTGLVTVGSAAAEGGRLSGYLMIAGPNLRIQCPVQDTYARLKDEVRSKLGLGLTELRSARIPPSFPDVVAEALLFPVGPASEEKAEERALEHAGRFFEDTWVHRPRRSLSAIAPVDAVGSPKLRRKVRGIVEFLRQCAANGMLAGYDFGRVLRKLGLSDATAAAPAAGSGADIGSMGPAELAALKAESLSNEQLEEAYRAAHRIDAQEIAAHFASALVTRPVEAGKADRFPFVSFLIGRALAEGNTDAALDQINEGMRVDCEQNEGRRRDDYELRRAAVHAQRGEADAAEEVFDRLIQRTPRNFKVRGQAAEVMLKLKHPTKALRFAEEGLKEARLANDRDAEGYLNDLAGAAKRQGA